MNEYRIQRLKDSIDLDYDFCRKYGFEFAKPQRELELYNEVIRLREENKDNEQLIETQLRDLEKQKQIIEKAVEYIEGTTFFGLRSGKTFLSKYLNGLLNILNGRSDE